MLKKRILSGALAVMCVLCAVSCNKNEEQPVEQTDGTTELETYADDESAMKIVDGQNTSYRIVYSSTSDEWARHSAEYMSERISNATGVTPRVASDASEPSDYEIIIGNTKRNDKLGFDVFSHDWELYPVHIGIYGNKILFSSDKNISIYESLSFVMDKWLEDADTGKLDINEKLCQRMMRAAGSVDGNVIKLLLQNVCTWGDPPNTPKERFERVYNEFTYYDPDIIGVSEQSDQWLNYLKGALGDQGYARLGDRKMYNDGGKNLGNGNNIYYKEDKFNVIEWDTFWYSSTPDVPGTTVPGAKDKQVATWAIFEIRATGRKFMVLNTHLHAYSDYGSVRSAQIEIFTEFLKPYLDQYPVYVMGDMNIEEKHTQYATMLETFDDARDIARENLSREQDTYNAYGGNGDYIFTGKKMNQEILWFKVINEKKFGKYSIAANEWVSDHYGVCVQTRVP